MKYLHNEYTLFCVSKIHIQNYKNVYICDTPLRMVVLYLVKSSEKERTFQENTWEGRLRGFGTGVRWCLDEIQLYLIGT